MRTKLLIGFILTAVIMTTLVTAAYSDEPNYPTRQMQVIVPAGPGGGTDTMVRAVTPPLSKIFGEQVLAVNKPGGGTITAVHFALKQSKADGYTMIADTHGSTSMMVGGKINPVAQLEDRIFISRLVSDSMAFAVKADAPWKDFREFTAWVKANPGEMTYGGFPAGTSHYAVNAWLTDLGLDSNAARLVIMDSGRDTLTKAAGGHITLACVTVGECYTLAQAGKLRVLAVAADERSPYMPDVPTMAEMGSPTIPVIWWVGISAPKGTPQYAVDKWAKALKEVAGDPAFQKQVQNRHANVSYLGPDAFKNFVYKETAFYTDLATKVGIRK